MNWSKDRIGAALLLGLFLVYGAQISNIETLSVDVDSTMNARSLPYVLTLLGLLGTLWMLYKPAVSEPFKPGHLRWPKLIAFILLMSVYGFALRPLGFLIASSTLLAGGFWLLGVRPGWRVLGLGMAVAGAFWLLLSYGLGLFLPPLPFVGAR